MKLRYLIPALGLVTGLAFTIDKAVCWTVEEKEAKISMVMPAEPNHSFMFKKLDAAICFDPANLSGSEIIARVDVKSLVTDDAGLTKHLLTKDFFDADKFPEIKFISTRIEGVGPDGSFIAYGALAMKDSVKAVSIPFKFEGDKKKGMLKGSFKLFAGDFGIMKKSKTGNDAVTVQLEIPVVKPK